MEIVQLPPLRMISGQPYSMTWVFREKGGSPIDFTKTVHGVSWSGRISFWRAPIPHPARAVAEFPLGLTASGRINLVLTAEDVRRLRGQHVTFQINLDAPVADLNEVWRGVVAVQ